MGGAIESRLNRKVSCRGARRCVIVSRHLIQVRRQHLLIDLGLMFKVVTFFLQILYASFGYAHPVLGLLDGRSCKVRRLLFFNHRIEPTLEVLNIQFELDQLLTQLEVLA